MTPAKSTRQMLELYFRAAFPCVALRTSEEARAAGEIQAAAKATGKQVVTWSATEGARDVTGTGRQIDDTQDLQAFCALRREQTVFVVRDCAAWPFDRDPVLARAFRDFLTAAPVGGSTVVLLDPAYTPHPTVAKLVTMMEYVLPTPDDLRAVVAGIKASFEEADGAPRPDLVDSDELVAAMSGMTITEAENALTLSVIETGRCDVQVVYREKVAAVKRSGLLEILTADPRGTNAMGGGGALKAWTAERIAASTAAGDAYGLPRAKGVLLVGPPGCLSGDTEVDYRRGERNSSRPITLSDLYLKFNGMRAATRPWIDLLEPTYLHSCDADGRVFYNRIVSVLQAGIKPVLRVTFEDGTRLTLTGDHPIMTPTEGFVPASDLASGSVVVARGSMKPTGDAGRDLTGRPRRVLVNLRRGAHPYGAYKVVEGKYEYTRVYRSRLVVEARMNGMEYEDYVGLLRAATGPIPALKYLPPEFEVHHMDENTLNDSLSNLMVLSKAEHARSHGKLDNFAVEYTREVRVVKIEPAGEEMTYDVQMDLPANNFCANGIVVHNTGKTLYTRAIATVMNRPLLKADLASVQNSLVGESERRLRETFALADSQAPCVLVLDEIDKALAGGTGSGAGDSGVTKRLVGIALTWMQDHTSDVFVIATANDVSGLDSALLRKGRFDEVFSVDLPTKAERAEILAIHLAARKRDPKAFDVARVAAATEGYTGSEIEAVLVGAMFAAFADGGREFTTADLVAAAEKMIPLSITAKDQIAAMRAWAATRATPASAEAQPGPAGDAPRATRNLSSTATPTPNTKEN